MERLVTKCCLDGLPVVNELLGQRAKIFFGQAFPNIIYGLLRRVQHVGLLEAIVTQLIEHNLVGREIAHTFIPPIKLVGSHQQSGF